MNLMMRPSSEFSNGAALITKLVQEIEDPSVMKCVLEAGVIEDLIEVAVPSQIVKITLSWSTDYMQASENVWENVSDPGVDFAKVPAGRRALFGRL